MEQERKSIRIGIWVIACAAILRLVSAGALQPVADFFRKPDTAAFLIYLGTGRVVHADELLQETQPQDTEPAPTQPAYATVPTAPAPSTRRFSREDASCLTLQGSAAAQPDIAALLMEPLSWQLRQDMPTVLILHTHTTESYTPGAEAYVETAAFRTAEDAYNMISIGQALAARLEAEGIRVIHDKTYHDYPVYNSAYGRSRSTVEEYLARYPSICLVLDLHRDAAEYSGGMQMTTQATVNGESSAQLMLVVGTDENLAHPTWQQNLALAAKLHVVLEQANPGICRPISLRAERFNQDLCPGTLLIEVGAAGNTRREALVAVQALADGILALADGCVTEDSTS